MARKLVEVMTKLVSANSQPLTILLAEALAFVLGSRIAETTKFGDRNEWGWVIGAPS